MTNMHDKNNTCLEKRYASLLISKLKDDPGLACDIKERVVCNIDKDYQKNYEESLENRIERTKGLSLFFDGQFRNIMQVIENYGLVKESDVKLILANQIMYKSTLLASITKARAVYKGANHVSENGKEYEKYLSNLFTEFAGPKIIEQIKEMDKNDQ